MNYTTKVTLQSKTHPDVRFTIRKLSEGRRIRIHRYLSDKLDKLDKLNREAMAIREDVLPVVEELKAAKDGKARAAILGHPAIAHGAVIQAEKDRIDADEIIPVFVRELLVSVEGLDIDGVAATPESLIDEGPEDLYNEIVQAIQKERGLSGEERGNSASPSTSTAQVAGSTNPTSAEDVKEEATT